MTLTEFLQGMADAIREKNGTTDPIAATDMAQAVKDLPTGDDNVIKYNPMQIHRFEVVDDESTV